MNKTGRYIGPLLMANFLFFAASCTSFQNTGEGIFGNVLRVFVRIDRITDSGGTIGAGEATNLIMEAGKARAAAILLSHVRLHATSPDQMERDRESIRNILENGRIAFRSCSDNHCSAFIDFTAGSVLRQRDAPLAGEELKQ